MKTNTLSMPTPQVNYMQVMSQRFIAFVKWVSLP